MTGVGGSQQGRTRPWGRMAGVVLAVALAAVGLAVNVWRPAAPALGEITTDLTRFAPQVLDAVSAYRDPRRPLAIVATVLPALVAVLLVVVPATRSRIVRLARRPRRPAVGAVLVAVVVVGAGFLATLPLEVWLGYVHEREWGFRTSGPGGWLRDWSVSVGLALGVAGVGGALFRWFVARLPRTWHWWLVALVTVVAAVLVFAHPLVVRPLFLTTSTLPDGPTRTAVEQVLATAGLEDVEVEVGDASRRTTRVNAFFTGLGPSRQVVLYDNLLTLEPDHVAHVVAHELAHREHDDTLRGTLLSASAALPLALVLAWLLGHRRVRRALEAGDSAAPQLVAVAMAFLLVTQLVGTPIANVVSRRAEAAADHRALELTGRPGVQVEVSRTFVVRDLSDPFPPVPLHRIFGTHPTTGQRIEAAVAYARRNDLPLPDLAALRAAERDRWHAQIAREEPAERQ